MAGENDLVVIALALDESNAEIVSHMRVMKAAREGRPSAHVVCAIGGFDADRRPLHDIPEARAFCRRLVDLGFISYLDLSTQLDPRQKDKLGLAWGAAEVWMCAGRKSPGGVCRVTAKLLEEFKQAVVRANAVADATLGPMREQQ